MKKPTRIFSILLTVAMLLGIMPLAVSAGGYIGNFDIRHDARVVPPDTCHTSVSRHSDTVLAGTHVITAGDRVWLVSEVDDSGNEFSVPIEDFVGNSGNKVKWHMVRIEYKDDSNSKKYIYLTECTGTPTAEQLKNGYYTQLNDFSCSIYCPEVDNFTTTDDRYKVNIEAWLSGSYNGVNYENLPASNTIYVFEEYWSGVEEGPILIDRDGENPVNVPITPKFLRHDKDHPEGVEADPNTTINFSGSNLIVDNMDGTAYLNNPSVGTYSVHATFADQWNPRIVEFYNCDYIVVDGDTIGGGEVWVDTDGGSTELGTTQASYWKLDKSGTLTFYGRGYIIPEAGHSQRPWEDLAKEYAKHTPDFRIKKVVVAEGITYLGSGILLEQALDMVELPSTLTHLDYFVFISTTIADATYNGTKDLWWARVSVGNDNENIINALGFARTATVNLVYDSSLASMCVADDTTSITGTGELPISLYGNLSADVNVTNVASGYRIKSLKMQRVDPDGSSRTYDLTEEAVNNGGTAYISYSMEDGTVLTITLELEALPTDLPEVTGVNIVSDYDDRVLTSFDFVQDSGMVNAVPEGTTAVSYAWYYSEDGGTTWKIIPSATSDYFYTGYQLDENDVKIDFSNMNKLKVVVTGQPGYAKGTAEAVIDAIVSDGNFGEGNVTGAQGTYPVSDLAFEVTENTARLTWTPHEGTPEGATYRVQVFNTKDNVWRTPYDTDGENSVNVLTGDIQERGFIRVQTWLYDQLLGTTTDLNLQFKTSLLTDSANFSGTVALAPGVNRQAVLTFSGPTDNVNYFVKLASDSGYIPESTVADLILDENGTATAAFRIYDAESIESLRASKVYGFRDISLTNSGKTLNVKRYAYLTPVNFTYIDNSGSGSTVTSGDYPVTKLGLQVDGVEARFSWTIPSGVPTDATYTIELLQDDGWRLYADDFYYRATSFELWLYNQKSINGVRIKTMRNGEVIGTAENTDIGIEEIALTADTAYSGEIVIGGTTAEPTSAITLTGLVPNAHYYMELCYGETNESLGIYPYVYTDESGAVLFEPRLDANEIFDKYSVTLIQLSNLQIKNGFITYTLTTLPNTPLTVINNIGGETTYPMSNLGLYIEDNSIWLSWTAPAGTPASATCDIMFLCNGVWYCHAEGIPFNWESLDLLEPGLGNIDGIAIYTKLNGQVIGEVTDTNLKIRETATTSDAAYTGTIEVTSTDEAHTANVSLSGLAANSRFWVNLIDEDDTAHYGGRTYVLTDENGAGSFTLTLRVDHPNEFWALPYRLYGLSVTGGVASYNTTRYAITKLTNDDGGETELPKQELEVGLDSITRTYGALNFDNQVTNNSLEWDEEPIFKYESSNPNVVTVDEDGYVNIIGVGTATITATAPAIEGYAETSISYTVTVAPAPLTVKANDHTITYGEAPANGGFTATGFVYDENLTVVTGTAVYSYSYEQYGNAGEYTITPSGLSAANYTITYESGKLTVAKATSYTITLGNLAQRDNDISAVTATIAPQDATAVISVEYKNVDGEWTSTLPTEAGEYAVRAALTDSANIVLSGNYTEGTLVISRSATVGGTDVKVEIEGGKAEVTVTDEDLENIANSAEGNVAVNLGDQSVDTMEFPGSLMETISNSEKASGMTISAGNTSIKMTEKVVDNVANQVSEGDKISLKMTTVNQDELSEAQKDALANINGNNEAVIVDVALVITDKDNNEKEKLNKLGGNVEITLPYPQSVDGKKIVVTYLDDQGRVTYVSAKYDANSKTITFRTNHFSHYAVFTSANPAVVVTNGTGGGIYAPNTTVKITANVISGCTFDHWEAVGITLADATKSTITFEMPGDNVELHAIYTGITKVDGQYGVYSAVDATLMIAVYGADDKFESVTITPIEAGTVEQLFAMPENSKAFLLDSSFSPLCPSVSSDEDVKP